MNIVADPNIPLVREAFAGLGQIEFSPGRQMTAAVVRDADVLLVRSVTPVNAALLDGSRVQFVATATIGTDHIDPEYLAARGIGFASAAGSNANSVAEYVVAALLEMARLHRFRLRDKTLGVVGVGHVGSRVVRYAEALGMRVLQNDPPRQRAERLPQFVSRDALWAGADILTLHVPLTREGEDRTFHWFGEDALAARTRRLMLINTARGAVVDNRALLQGIRNRKFSGVVLDVWETEPRLDTELLEAVDIGTPHIAGYSYDGKVNGTRMIYEAVCRFFHQEPRWDPSLWMPPAPVPRLEVRGREGDDEEELLRQVVRAVYDIRADDANLRRNPEDFDRLRAAYPMRREFFHTALAGQTVPDRFRETVGKLGFRRV